MVKPIKKRVPKAANEQEPVEAQTAEPDVDEAPAPELIAGGLADQDDDRFTKRTAGLFHWIIQNGKLLSGVGVAIALGVGGWVIVQSSASSKDAEATRAFLSAVETEATAISALDEAGAAPSTEARLKQLEKARTLYTSAKDSFSGQRVAGLAQLGLAGVQLELGQTAEAIAQYDAFVAQGSKDPFAQAVALQAKAAAQENAGDIGAAKQSLEALKSVDAQSFGLLAELELGRIEEGAGQGAAALSRYKAAKTTYAQALELPSNRGYKLELERREARLGQAL